MKKGVRFTKGGQIIVFTIILSIGIIAGCVPNSFKVFSIKTPLLKNDGDDNSNNNELIIHENTPRNEDMPVENQGANISEHPNDTYDENNDPSNNTQDSVTNTRDDDPDTKNVGNQNSSEGSSVIGKNEKQDNNDLTNKNESFYEGKYTDIPFNDSNTLYLKSYQDYYEDLKNSEKEMAVPIAKIIRNSSDKEKRQVAITFDDGPDSYFTPQVLDILKEYNTKATFFIVGSNGEKNMDILRRISEEGHVIANHSWGHRNFSKISKNKIVDELTRTDELIEEITGKSHHLFRLPYGAFNKRALKVIADRGFHNIYWSIDPRDWSGNSPKKILNIIKNNIEPGSIILLHSNGSGNSISNTIKALPKIIEFLQGEGYEMLTIPKLLEDTLYIEN